VFGSGICAAHADGPKMAARRNRNAPGSAITRECSTAVTEGRKLAAADTVRLSFGGTGGEPARGRPFGRPGAIKGLALWCRVAPTGSRWSRTGPGWARYMFRGRMPGHPGAYRGVSGISERTAPTRLAAMPSSGQRRWPRPGQKSTRAEARFYAHADVSKCVCVFLCRGQHLHW
jgi:hypothetical protein